MRGNTFKKWIHHTSLFDCRLDTCVHIQYVYTIISTLQTCTYMYVMSQCVSMTKHHMTVMNTIISR